MADRIARLIRQLGHDEYAKREEATKQLDTIGKPALDALKTAVSSSDDPEIRLRAAKIVRAVTGRIRAAATRKALEKLQGTWSLVSYETDGKQIKGEDKTHIFTVKADRWSIHIGSHLFQAGTVTSIEAKEKLNAIDLLITEGSNIGATATSIYAIEGNTLKYLNCGDPRVTTFATKPGDGCHYLIFRRAGPGAARRPEVRFESAIHLNKPPQLFPPCHADCFPDCIKAIDNIRKDSLVTTIDSQGKSTSATEGDWIVGGRYQSIFTGYGRFYTHPVGHRTRRHFLKSAGAIGRENTH